MVWDLRAALLKKGEFESARLADFEFRERARTMALLAPLIDPELDPATLVADIARHDDDAILAGLSRRYPTLVGTKLRELFQSSRTEARRQLVAELGDPTPYKLA